jgi:hypothetical protein
VVLLEVKGAGMGLRYTVCPTVRCLAFASIINKTELLVATLETTPLF